MTTLNILWSDLVATPRNVRKVKTGIESLAASMASEDGQIQNLVVIAREDGKYEVIVGERRRRAAKPWAVRTGGRAIRASGLSAALPHARPARIPTIPPKMDRFRSSPIPRPRSSRSCRRI